MPDGGIRESNNAASRKFQRRRFAITCWALDNLNPLCSSRCLLMSSAKRGVSLTVGMTSCGRHRFRTVHARSGAVVRLLGAVIHQPDPADRNILMPWKSCSGLLSMPVFRGHVSRAFVKAAIDVAAEDERLKDITDGAGQAMTDQQTADEGRQYIAVAGMAERLSFRFPSAVSRIGNYRGELGEVAVVVSTLFGMEGHWRRYQDGASRHQGRD